MPPRPTSPPPGLVPTTDVVASVLAAAVFAAAVLLGRATRVDGVELALFWPAAGVGFIWVAAVRTRPRKAATAALLALVATAVNLGTGVGWGLSVGFGLINAAQAALTCVVWNRVRGTRFGLRTLRDLRALLLASAVGGGAGGLVSAGALALLASVPIGDSLLPLVLRNTAGTVVIAAAALAGAAEWQDRWTSVEAVWRSAREGWSRPRLPVETPLVVVAAVLPYVLVFSQADAPPVSFAVLPATVLVALRLRTTAVAVHVLVVGTLLVLLTREGRGPFGAESPVVQAMITQAFVGVLTLTALIIALHRDERAVLAASVEEARAALDRAQVLAGWGSWHCDVASGVTRWSHGLQVLLGVPDGAVTSRGVLVDVVAPADRETVARLLDDGPEGSFGPVDVAVPSGDGERVLEVQAHRVRSADGRLVSEGTVRDVTQARAAARRLADEEARSRALLRAVPDAVLVVGLDGTVLQANEQAEVLFGRSADDLVGGEVERLVPAAGADHHRRLREGFVAGAGDRGGRPALMTTGPRVVAARPDGSTVPVEVNLAMISLDAGPAILASVRDVTRARALQHDLADANARYAGLLDGATEHALVATDAQGRITLFNRGAERLLGWTQEEVLGRSPLDFHDAAEVERLMDEHGVCSGVELLRAQADGRVEHTRACTWTTKGGESRQVRLTTTPTRAADGSTTGYLLLGTDVSDRVRAETALAASERRFRLAFRTARVGMALVDLTPGRRGRLLQVNRALAALLGRDEADLLEDGLVSSAVEEDGRTTPLATRRFVRFLLAEDDDAVLEQPFAGADGRRVRGLCSGTTVDGSDGGAGYRLVIVEDVTARRAAEEALRHQAEHDVLTGLPNRAACTELLARLLAGAERSSTSVGVLYLDLDGFKSVNDTAGHAAGDELLRQAAQRLRLGVGPGRTAARLGGDEFVVLCPDVDSPETLRELGAHLTQSLGCEYQVSAGRPGRGVAAVVTASVGMAIGTPGTTAERLLQQADEAMYAAKRAGKNRVASLDDPAVVQADRASRLLWELHRALEEDELVLHGQPVVDLASGAVVAVETLLRWQHPRRGQLPPADFLAAAEGSALMQPVGRRALDESCRIAVALSERLGARAPDVHVNIFGRQLEGTQFAAEVHAALDRYGLPASRLVLELTETYLPTLTPALLEDLEGLRSRGVRLAIDDVGTGYSSLSRLTELPVDMLKIDRRFVAMLGQAGPGDAIVRSVIGLGRALGLSVVAEGVETPAQVDTLLRFGCDTAQGYLYSPPRPEDELIELLTTAVDAPATG